MKTPKREQTTRTTECKGVPSALHYPVRLNRYIAHCGLCCRRKADLLIAQGRISVNGQVVSGMGTRVHKDDAIHYQKKLLSPQRFFYFLLNKPKGYITTTKDEKGRPTVMSLMKGTEHMHVLPVGRLDRDTTGLLLFTNDGQLTQQLTHPVYGVVKTYEITLREPLSHTDFLKIKAGITLKDGFIKPDAIHITAADRRTTGLQIHSGKNHIVRRIFGHLNHTIIKLDRIAYSLLTKKNLPRGTWRMLSPKEIHFLRQNPREAGAEKTKHTLNTKGSDGPL